MHQPDQTAWRRCSTCDVAWHDDSSECWSCGRRVHPTSDAYPTITSRAICAAMSDAEWNRVRTEVRTA